MHERSQSIKKKKQTKKANSALKAQNPDFRLSTNTPADRILSLQRTIGNRALQRLFRSKSIQAKLTIGKPDDMYEQEANRVAEGVIRMPAPALQPT